MYHISVYYVSKLMIELPMMFLSVLISSSTVFLIVGLENTITHWLYYRKFLRLFSFLICNGRFGGLYDWLCDRRNVQKSIYCDSSWGYDYDACDDFWWTRGQSKNNTRLFKLVSIFNTIKIWIQYFDEKSSLIRSLQFYG